MEAAPTRPSAAPLISWAGAQKLTQMLYRSSAPSIRTSSAWCATALFMAWASLPAVAHVDGRNTSDSVRRYLRVEGQHVHYNARRTTSRYLTCFDTPLPDHGGRVSRYPMHKLSKWAAVVPAVWRTCRSSGPTDSHPRWAARALHSDSSIPVV